MNKIKIVIFGLGVVGSHVVKLLEKNKFNLNGSKFEIIALGAKNKSKKRNSITSMFRTKNTMNSQRIK